jgi:hypothetical protein
VHAQLHTALTLCCSAYTRIRRGGSPERLLERPRRQQANRQGIVFWRIQASRVGQVHGAEWTEARREGGVAWCPTGNSKVADPACSKEGAKVSEGAAHGIFMRQLQSPPQASPAAAQGLKQCAHLVHRRAFDTPRPPPLLIHPDCLHGPKFGRLLTCVLWPQNNLSSLSFHCKGEMESGVSLGAMRLPFASLVHEYTSADRSRERASVPQRICA